MAYGTYDKYTQIFQCATHGIDLVSALEVAAGDLAIFDVVEPITVTRFGVLATVTYDYDSLTTQGQVSLDRRVAYGSDTGRVQLAVIKQADTTPAGTVIKKDFNPVNLDVGDQLVLEAKVQAAGGTEVGDWKAFFCYHPRAEVMANQSEQTDTA